ncbi:MAG: hypothetical protein FWD25_03315 [Clostridia bacterium]|nr:hypothetical protein [Clostridia bacterium]
MRDFDVDKAVTEIAAKLDKGRYPEFAPQFGGLIRRAVELDLAFMEECGSAFYDDDEAFEYILEGIARERGWGEDKMVRLGALIDDYMEAQERYMEAAGLLEWD